MTCVCGNYFCYCAALLLQTQLQKTQTQLWKTCPVSKAAPCLRNVCVYEPTALWRKPSIYSVETFQFLEEAFRFAAQLCCKHMFRKTFQCNVDITVFEVYMYPILYGVVC